MNLRLWLALAVAVLSLPLQGYVVFLWAGLSGDFVSLNGLKCGAGAAAIDVALFAVALLKYEQLHAGAMLNPQGPIGLALELPGQAARAKSAPGGGANLTTPATAKGRSSFATLDEVRRSELWEA